MAAPLADPALPAVERLLGDGAEELAAAWLRPRGAALRSLRPTKVLYSPGRSISVVYRAAVAWEDGAAEADEQLVAAAEAGGGDPALWLYPHDSALPGLARLADDQLVAELADRVGLPDAPLELRDRAYRPATRATVELAAVEERLVFAAGSGKLSPVDERMAVYLKALRPGRAEAVGRRLGALGTAIAVPACRLVDDDLGLVVVDELPGRTLQQTLREGGGALPAAGALLELLDGVARAGAGFATPAGAPRTTADRARGHARLLGAVLPEHAARVGRFVDALGPDAPEPVIAAHNDLHPSQLLVDDSGAIAGVLDVDGVGPGRRTDDLASMLGRVWTSGATAGRGRERFAAYAEQLHERFAAVVDPRELCRRTAGVVLGRATGPFRVQQRDWQREALRRLELAERWLESAPTGEPPAPEE